MDPLQIITTLGGCFVEPIKEHCGYLFHYGTNIEVLTDQIQKLRAMRDTLQLQEKEEEKNDKVMAPVVWKWVNDANVLLKDANVLLKKLEDEKNDKEEAPKKCLEIEEWGPHYHLSKKAKKKSLKINELLGKAEFPIKTSYSRSLTGIGSSSSEGIKHFESRTKMEDKVLKALEDNKVNMVLICGMGGIGKTTMAKEVEKKAIDKKLFNKSVTAVVSRTPNWTKIRDQIAETLRQRNSGSVLVILDDVWQALNLGDIGILYGGEVNCCKILLTSRSEEVLINKKKDLKIFKIDDLSEEEAWNLFIEVAGDCVDTPDINSIAKEVVKECGRLPQAIVTVGAALQNKSTVEWRVALGQLQNSTPECIHGLDPTVYSSIEFSYSNLQDEAVKSCFLLCCLFPEDCDIPIEYLVRYGVGKRLFEMIDNMAVARDRVHAIIKNLQRSSLLLDSKKEECVKMHDVIRDVAISIAKKEKGFLVRCTDKIEEWPEQDTYEHSAISLVSQELKKHPDGLECPKLELLQLACGKNCTKTQTFPSNMFKEMNKLKVLSMEGMSFSSLPQSILVLQNLRTLLLDYCKIEDVSKIGALGKLEILSFLGSNIKELPREIGNLSHLKLLDLSNCSALRKIPAGLLSRLNYLEELYMFGVNKEGAIASLAELKSLSKRFSALKIHIPNIEVLPKDLLFKNPELKFQIFAGEEGIYQELSGTGSYLFENSLALEKCKASDIVESPVLLQLLKKSKILYLKQIKDLKNILYGLDQEGFQCLKILRVIGCEDVEYVINATSHQTSHAAFPILESLEFSDLCNLKEIFHSQFPERSFSNSRLACFGNLRSLLLSRCSRLKNVFSLSIARGLVQLQQLAIDSCADMEEIFPKEGEDEKALEVIRFPELTSIKLFILPKLIGFCTTVYPIGPVQPSLNPEGNLIKLKNPRASGIDNPTEILSLFPSHMIESLRNLESIKLWRCDSLEVIFQLEELNAEESHVALVLDQLRELDLSDLPKLKHIWMKGPERITGFGNLRFLAVRTCKSLTYLLSPSIAKLLVMLEDIKVIDCEKIEEILERAREEEEEKKISFNKVKSILFKDLPKLKCFCNKVNAFEQPSLKEITGTLFKSKNPRASGIDNPTEIWPLFSSHMIESLRDLESIKLWRCDSLKVIFQLEELNVEVASLLDQLRELDLSDLPKLEHIWVKGPERITGFGNLRFLAVRACNSLTYLLSPSIAKLLVMLEDIKVNNCKKIEEILEIASEEEKEKKISFYKVKSIWLEDLPNLKCFCNEANAFKWPSLKKITVIRCHALCTFVPSDLNTPKLEGVYGQNESDQQTMFPWKGDLNATIQHMFKGKEKQMDQVTRLQGKKIKENLLEQIRQQICHPSLLNSNIKNLKDQFEKLRDKRVEVESEIDAAKQNGKIIAPVVKRWVEKVENISRDLQRFLDEDVKANEMCLDGWCPNPKTRYSLSRKAKKKTLEIDGLLSEAALFVTEVSYPPLSRGIGSSSIEGIMDFESRKKMKKEVLEALRDAKNNMIAICGMGGIGKTAMAKEVAKRAKDDELFDEVVMVVVSQNQDLRNIQVHIAKMLGLQLVEENPLVRTEQLRKRLMDSKSVLVILDDVWDALDLKAVGIPYGGQHNSCKILLTSRSEEVCTQMGTQKIFPIKVLSKEEAWNLFKEKAGNCIDTPGLHPIAKEVAKQCGGLPVAIVTIGRALKNKSKFVWSDVLRQLKMAIPKNIPGLDSQVYSSIELSYSSLKSDEAKSCFLLCCLFPEDSDILIEYLVRYGMGQRLLANIDTVAEARNRVHAIVKNLKRSSLLLYSEKEECVKMHNVVRYVAISIAADNHGFLVQFDDKMEEWPEKDSYEHSTAISLVSRELKRYPDGLECPKLELLQLSCGKFTSSTLLDNFFEGMNKLKVLSLQGMSFQALPPSIRVLQNLQTLHLEYCSFDDVSEIGALGNLEILSFVGSKIKELPGEIGNLSHLKLLDLSNCSTLQKIPPDLLSSLNQLEELYMFGVDVNWEPMEGNEEGANTSLAKVIDLPHHLMALKIHIPNIEVLPKDLLFRNQMIKFQIFAGDIGGMDDDFVSRETGHYLFENKLVLGRSDASNILESGTLLQLIAKSGILYLEQINDLKNILYELDQEGFQCLKVLRVSKSEAVQYVIDATSYQTPHGAFPILNSLKLSDLGNLKEIVYHSQFPEGSLSHAQLACFGNLRFLVLSRCSRLKNVFSLYIARDLDQLQQLHIEKCEDMEEIFPKEGGDEHVVENILFPTLRSIKLSSLPRLIGFCADVGLVELVQQSLNPEVGKIDSHEVTSLEKHEMTDIQQHASVSFPKSTPVSHKFFSSKTNLWAPNLEELELDDANSLEAVFDLEGLKVDHHYQQTIVFAGLKTLTVRNLYKLMHVWNNVSQGIQGFQNLTSIEVEDCDRLRYLFPPSVAKLLVELRSIDIRKCSAIENIVQRDGEEEAADIIVFPKVKVIHLYKCPKLKTFGSEIWSPRKQKKISTRESVSRPQESGLKSSLVRDSPGILARCLECVPRRKNNGPIVVSESDRGTTNKSQESSSVNKEGTSIALKDPRFYDSIDNPSNMWSLFPLHMITSLKNLESIYLGWCTSVEVIFQLEELNVEESYMASVLTELRELNLCHLDKLMHIWKSGPERIMGFQNLRLLEVRECNNLTNLFSPSIANLLVMLEQIKVLECEKIQEILARSREEEKEEEVLFYKVNSILLEDLPNLKCFCNEANAFEWPSLQKMTIIRCPNLRTFVQANLNTPELEGVYADKEFKTRQWEGNLNATIEHIYKGKEKQGDHETQQQEQMVITEIEEDM